MMPLLLPVPPSVFLTATATEKKEAVLACGMSGSVMATACSVPWSTMQPKHAKKIQDIPCLTLPLLHRGTKTPLN